MEYVLLLFTVWKYLISMLVNIVFECDIIKFGFLYLYRYSSFGSICSMFLTGFLDSLFSACYLLNK